MTVTGHIAIAAARGILEVYDKNLLAENGGHIVLTKQWAYSLLHRMKFVKRRMTTAKSKYSSADLTELKRVFLEEVVAVATMEEVPPELILNCV